MSDWSHNKQLFTATTWQFLLLIIVKTAQHRVHLTGGILRHFRAFSTPEQNPALAVLSRPAHPQVTQTVGQSRAK